MSDADVVVVGAGLAGLQCARDLRRRGLHTVVLEASSAPGGRVRTDVVDGFRCDRGFQLLNPAYPAVRRHVDVDALDLKAFGRGVVTLTPRGPELVADPIRHPRLLLDILTSGDVRPGELARLVAWLAPALGSVRRLLDSAERDDETVASSWDRARIRGRLRTEVLEPFLTGVLIEELRGGHGSTSAAFVRLLLRSFVLATPAVPALGMQALPDQLSRGLEIRYDSPVRVVGPGPGGLRRVETAGGRSVAARAVVIATDPISAADLTPLPRPMTKGLRTWWFEAGALPRHPTFLRVDGRGPGAGPVINTAAMNAVAPSYAPPGRHLVQATTLLPSPAGEPAVRTHLAELWAMSTTDWSVVTRHDVEVAQPSQPPPLDVRRPVDLGDGLFVAGDHRDTASIQGALVSGARTAAALARSLGA